MKGYISIHREIADHWLWEKKPFSYGQAWIDLILLANHKTEKFLYRDQLIEGQRGTVYRSLSWLSDRWGWGRKKTSRFLSVLESDGMLSVNSTTKGTTITIVNYGKYQDHGTIKGTTEEQLRNNRGTTEEQLRNTYNNSNNSNNSNKSKGHFVPPTASEIADYCLESGHKVDADAFIDFYASKNWMVGKNKMKDWRAAVRTWERRQKEQGRPSGSGKSYQNFQSSGIDWNEAAYKIMGY